MLIFTPPVSPSIGLVDKPEVKLRKSEFGDGYSQIMPAGLNHVRRVVSIKWNVLALDEAQAIEGFFKAQRGCDPFLFTIPREPTPVKWTCEDWSSSRNTGSLASIEATFRQSFDLRS